MSNDFPGFPMPDETGKDPLDPAYGTIKVRRQAPCPGTYDNTVLLIKGPDIRDGIIEPKNVGTCTLHIACYDINGTFIGTYHLAPGESYGFLEFPANAESVRFGCQRDCSGTAILEYRYPYIS